MKKALLVGTIVILVVVAALVFVGCDSDKGNGSVATDYTIQYTDEQGAHVITVQDGMPYVLPSLPTKEGYDFLGLYTAQTGGTQYVDEKGASLAVFSGKKNMVLFAQFAPKQYKVVLDYQGAAVTGNRQYTVEYGDDLPYLPKNLAIEHKDFMGWYTAPDCGGTQVCDQYGNIPLVSTISSENYDPNATVITLYAGFAWQTYTVTFCADARQEEQRVVYNTPVNDILPSFRKDGNAVLSWSKVQNDTELTAVFTGKVTENMVLYAAEWAPVLEFDTAGGNSIAPIIAKSGATISLPKPVRTDYTFVGWRIEGGAAFTAQTMPSKGQKLTAKWNAQLIFDANGGMPVATITAEAGTTITLPTTEREDYIFAGWYTSDGTRYTSTTMPQTTERVMAKYCTNAKKKYVLVTASSTVKSDTTTPSMSSARMDLDLTELYNMGVQQITVKAYYQACISGFSTATYSWVAMKWYSQQTASDAYKVCETSVSTTYSDWSSGSLSTTIALTGPKIYICGYSRTGAQFSIRDFYVEVEYLDMSTLY